jgi:hypothetical protein
VLDATGMQIGELERTQSLGVVAVTPTVFGFFVALSPDGHTLAVTASLDTVRLYERTYWRNLADLEAQVCGLVVGNLTRNEWATLAPGLADRTTCPS